MDAELTLEPPPEKLPEAVAFSPERAPAAPLDSIGVIPPQVAERVTIAPPPSWVVERALEPESDAPVASNRYLLIDHQHDVERVRNPTPAPCASWIRSTPCRNQGSFASISTRAATGSRFIRWPWSAVPQRAENARLERLRLLQREAGTRIPGPSEDCSPSWHCWKTCGWAIRWT